MGLMPYRTLPHPAHRPQRPGLLARPRVQGTDPLALMRELASVREAARAERERWDEAESDLDRYAAGLRREAMVLALEIREQRRAAGW